MKKMIINKGAWKVFSFLFSLSLLFSCAPQVQLSQVGQKLPENYSKDGDTSNIANQNWRAYFKDQYLISLIDSALANNQEINIYQTEIEYANAEIRERKAEYIPQLGIGLGADLDKVGSYTRSGAVEENLKMGEDQIDFPEPFSNLRAGAFASWEVDIWKKLRNAKKAAYLKYLATVEGKRAMTTNLVAEIATNYYELLALDQRLRLVLNNIDLQQKALDMVKLQKQSSRLNELAVKRFEAQLANTSTIKYQLKQQIIEKENQINYLVGRLPQNIERDTTGFNQTIEVEKSFGVPTDLLVNRPDIRKSELELQASNLDIQVARAAFLPQLGVKASLGQEAFNVSYWLDPFSLFYGAGIDLIAPLLNRNQLKAELLKSSAVQKRAVLEYEKRLIQAYQEVSNQMMALENYHQSFEMKKAQQEALINAVEISNQLFKAARADYLEVLLTQREMLEASMELTEIKMLERAASVNIYRALGGGWQ